MRNTRKILVAFMLVLAMLVGMTAIFASAAGQPETLYLTPNANWKADNARFAAYFFGNGETWVSMTDTDGDGVYEVKVPTAKTYPSVIFCRMNPSATANNWDNKWNQTADLTIPTGGTNHYTVKEGTWDKGGGTWSTYGSTCKHTNLGDAATCTTAQVCLDCGDPVVSALGHSFNSAHNCTRCGGQASFTVAGTGAHLGTEWDTGNTANDMTYADGVYTKVYEKVAAGSYKFKVARDHDWGTAYPSTDKSFTVAESGSTVTITLTGTTVAVKVDAPVQEPDHVHSWSDATCTEPQKCECGQAQGEALGHTFDADGKCTVCEFVALYIVAGDVMQVNEVYQQGTNFFGSSWSATDENNKLVYNAETGLFEKTYTGVKIGEYHYQVTSNGSWFGVDNSYINVTADNSTVTITFNPKGNVMNATVAAHTHAYEAVVTAPTCTAGGYTTYTCACNDSYVADETAATGHTCVLDICLVCYLPQPSIVLGDNTVVVPESSGSAFGMIYISEAGTYQISATPATTACIFSTNIYSEGADFSIAADGALGASWYVFSVTPVELQPGWYYIGVYGLGEYTVNLSTYVAPEEPPVVEPVDPIINISDLEAGTTTDAELVEGTGIYAYAGLTIDSNKKEIDGFSFTKRLKLPGTMKVEDGVAMNYVKVELDGAAKIVLYAMAGNSSATDRFLQVATLADGAFTQIAVTESYVDGAAIAKYEFAIDAAGTYYIGSTKSGINIYYIEIEKAAAPVEPPHENTLAVGDTNKIVVDGSVLNAYGQPIAWVEFVADEKAHYEFVGTDGALVFIYAGDIDINNAPAASLCGYTGKADLEAGTYLICVGGGITGEFNVAVSKSEIPETPIDPPVDPPVTPEYPSVQVGENTVTIDGSVVNLTGNAIAWYEFTVETAGTYAIVSDSLNGYFYSKPDIGDFSACVCGFKGVADLEPGTYYICVGKDGKTGEFSLSIVTGEIEAPATNTVVLGENKYVLNAPLLAIGYEFITFTAEKTGWYTISGADPITFFIWPDYPNVAVTDIPTTAPYAWNVKHDNSGFEESFTVYLEEGVYAVGFRYDFAEVGEYDYTITYSETDPNPPVEQPPVEEPELNFFEKIWASIVEFFNQLVAWFQNLFAANKE